MLKKLALTLVPAITLSITLTGCVHFGSRTGTVQVIAHRGASAYAPENTLASFALAAEMKADFAELDCQLTRDGVLMVAHDATVDRTTDGKGKVATLTMAELKRLDAGSWKDPKYAGERLPTLREMLEFARSKRMGVYIHIKSFHSPEDKALEQWILDMSGDRVLTRDPAFAREVMQTIESSKTANLELTRKTIALVRELGMQKQVVIQSFSAIGCAITRIEAPEIYLGLLEADDPQKPFAYPWNDFLRWERLLGVNGCNISDQSVTPERVRAFHGEGRTVAVWTVDDPAEMKRFVEAGVDQIITDKPDLCLQVLKANRHR